MQIVIDIPERMYTTICGRDENKCNPLESYIKNGTLLKILDDGTLSVTVDDYPKVKRVLVQDKDNNGGLFYADSN